MSRATSAVDIAVASLLVEQARAIFFIEPM